MGLMMGLRGRRLTAVALAVSVLAAMSGIVPGAVVSAAGVTVQTGTIGTAAYAIEVPANWNGTLALYSHGYRSPGSPNPASDAGDPATRAWLLGQGYALAGSSYSSTGFALEGTADQLALLDFFEAQFGTPQRTIAWGHSLGGLGTALLVERQPERFAAALPMCGPLAGGLNYWNAALDSAFVFKTLLAPTSGLQLVNIQNPAGNVQLAEGILAQAQTSPQGRARVALAAAMLDLPGWFDPASPEPASADVLTRELNQAQWEARQDLPFDFGGRAELELRVGGNFSSNAGVDYREQLAHSSNRAEVRALYDQAGLGLSADLDALEAAPRIEANPAATSVLGKASTLTGLIQVPVLTMHTTGDGLVPVEDERAYASFVRAADDNALLRQTFVHRAGHCTFTPAETIAAFQTLVRRLDTGTWTDGAQPAELNEAATALGPSFNIVPAAFIRFVSPQFPRLFDISASTID